MEKYSYSAEDKSLLTPLIEKFFAGNFVNILPASVPANMITICSNSFVLISFAIAYLNYINGTSKFLWLIPFLCFAYIVGDYSDGMQARKTHTGSPLGEYLDHFLDSFVTGFLTGTLMLSFRITNPILFFCTYQFLYMGQIGSFWERLKTGVMRFSKLSSSEGVMAIAIMASLYPVKIVYESNLKALFFGFSLPQIFIFTAYAGAFFTGIVSILRTKQYGIRLPLHIIFSLWIGAVLVWYVNTSILLHTVIISFYNVFFISSLLAATNQNKKESFPDFIVPLSCIIFFIIPQYAVIIQICQSVYLFCIVLIRFVIFFRKYKNCWYWKNPEIKQEI